MIDYGGIRLTEIVRTGNKWERVLLFDEKPACVIAGYGVGFNVTVRWKQYSMILRALTRIVDVISKLNRETGEVME